MTIDVETADIDIESFYLFKMGVRKEGAQAQVSHGGGGQAQLVSGACSHISQGYTETWPQFSFQASSHEQQIITDLT